MHLHSVALPQLQSLLEVNRLIREQPGHGDLFDEIAATIASSLGFRTVSIRVYRPASDDFEVVTVHGSEEARRALLGTRRSLHSLESYLSERFYRRGAYWVPHDEADWEDPLAHVPQFEPPVDPEGWHAEDALMVPLKRSDGELLGIVSVDEPESGRRPSDEELDLLVVLAEHVAFAIEAAQKASSTARDRAALARLLDVSASLVDLESVEAVLAAVAQGISDALEFEKVAVCLVAADGGFVPAGTAGWEEGAPELDFALSVYDLGAVCVPEFEIEGCYLIDHATASALVGTGSAYASRRNGSGPLAWQRHWLIVPLIERDGSLRGFVWADDPVDCLLPSPQRLQALRTFSNQASMALRAALDFETLNARNSELAGLHETTYALLEHRDRDTVLATIVDSARSLLGTDHGYLYLVDEEAGRLKLAVGFGYFATVDGPDVAPGEGVSGRVWETVAPVVVDDYRTWPHRLAAFQSDRLHATAGVPLLVQDRVIGILGVVSDDRGRRFAPAEIALLQRLAQLAALALENARLHESAQREIVERDRLHGQLRQAQKMEAIGRLAGGIAHDFNNLLTAIGGYAELGLADLEGGSPEAAAESITQIRRASSRAAELTAQLLAFSRKQVLDLRELDVNEVVSDMASMLARMLGEDIVLSAQLDPELGTVMADPGQVEQMVMNLAINARDAMPGGGNLSIVTSNIELSPGEPPPAPELLPGSYVLLRIADTGVGMEPELAERVFEPFFTTKDVGEGTGLGLATVHGIVSQSGGAVWAESEPGVGTCFSICLPRRG